MDGWIMAIVDNQRRRGCCTGLVAKRREQAKGPKGRQPLDIQFRNPSKKLWTTNQCRGAGAHWLVRPGHGGRGTDVHVDREVLEVDPTPAWKTRTEIRIRL